MNALVIRKITCPRCGLPALLAILTLSFAGCSTPGSASGKSRHFREASSASVVLQFSSWEYTFMVQPRYDENGFLQPVPRDGLGRVLDQVHASRDLAVVVIGWTYGSNDIEGLVREWKSILGGCGFRRAVLVRPNDSDKLDGSLIIDDSILSVGSEQAAAAAPRPAR